MAFHIMHPLSTIEWFALWDGQVIGHFIFEDEKATTVIVNVDRYYSMISQWVWPILENMDITNFWFQQNGATFHNSLETVSLFNKTPWRCHVLK